MSTPNRLRSFFDEPVGVAFASALQQTIEMYFGHVPTRAAPQMGTNLQLPYHVAGLIHFTSHEVDGSMVIAFRDETICKIYGSMIGEDGPATITSEVEDCVGELANTVYGLAKAPLVDKGYEFPMGRPTVIRDLGAEIGEFKSLELPFRFSQDKDLCLILVVRRLIEESARAS